MSRMNMSFERLTAMNLISIVIAAVIHLATPAPITTRDVSHVQACPMVPNETVLKTQYNQYREKVSNQVGHESLYTSSPQKQYTIADHLSRSSNGHVDLISWEDIKCPSLENATSTCPTYNPINNDVTRYPENLFEVRCKTCTKCLGTSDSSFGCQGVFYNVPVLRRTSKCTSTGEYIYEESWHKLSVGCACSKIQTGANPLS